MEEVRLACHMPDCKLGGVQSCKINYRLYLSPSPRLPSPLFRLAFMSHTCKLRIVWSRPPYLPYIEKFFGSNLEFSGMPFCDTVVRTPGLNRAHCLHAPNAWLKHSLRCILIITLFGRSRIQISARRPAIPTEAIRGFSKPSRQILG
jgi:hypothetical protein